MIIRQMYLFDPVGDARRFRVGPVLWITSGALVLGVMFIGIYPGPVFKAADSATQSLFADTPAVQARQP
jgi:hypothetical protein